MSPPTTATTVRTTASFRRERGKAPSVPEDLLAALRSDHAGETGAVYIYRGILTVSRDSEVRDFAIHHLATEQQHLNLMEEVLPPEYRSRLLPAWRLAGWLTGALPALFGRAAVFRTIDAVESFVDRHYQAQVDQLHGRPSEAALCRLLESCQADEIAHRDDARGRIGTPSRIGRLWTSIVDFGSRAGVYLASRL